MNEEPKIKFSIYVIKKTKENEFKTWFKSLETIKLIDRFDGEFTYFQSPATEPIWLTRVRSILSKDTITLSGQSAAGLIAIKRGGYLFVISFGFAWSKLKTQWIEPRFGMKVVLSNVPRDSILGLNTEQIFGSKHIAEERSPRTTKIDEFFVEFDRDLVGVIEGKPDKDELFGKKIRGGNCIGVNVALSNLSNILDECIDVINNKPYQSIWPEIDYINVIKDDFLISKLENQLDSDLTQNASSNSLSLFPQDFDDALEVNGYAFGKKVKNPVIVPYLSMDFWLNYLRRRSLNPSLEQAKNTKIHFLDSENEIVRSKEIFDCLSYEVQYEGRLYFLSAGNWYEVKKEFLQEVDDYIKKISSMNISLLDWNEQDKEGEYNKKCAQNNSSLYCMDAKNIYYGGGHSQLEWCDLFHKESNTLIFVKNPSGCGKKRSSKSAGMSHLYEQVRRTAELFFNTDGEYRERLIKKLQWIYPSEEWDWLNNRPKNSDWSLGLVSLGKSASELPFFAKCGLRRVSKDLSSKGFNVSFTKK